MLEVLNNVRQSPILISNENSSNAFNLSNLYGFNASKYPNLEEDNSNLFVLNDDRGDLLIPMIKNFNNFNFNTNAGWESFHNIFTNNNVTEMSRLKITYPYTNDFTIEFSHLMNNTQYGIYYAKYASYLFSYTTGLGSSTTNKCYSHGELNQSVIMYIYITSSNLFNPTSFGIQSLTAFNRYINYVDFAIYTNDTWSQIYASGTGTKFSGSEITYFSLSTNIYSNKFRIGVRCDNNDRYVNLAKLRVYGNYQEKLKYYTTPYLPGKYLTY